MSSSYGFIIFDTFLSSLLQSWSRLVEDYQGLCRQLEAVECSMPTVGLVEETEERLVERISLYQARKLIQADFIMQNVIMLNF